MGQVHRANDPDVISSVDVVLYEARPAMPGGSLIQSESQPHPESYLNRRLLSDKTDLDLALARQFPAFRRLVVDRIIHMVSRENTLFAVATALPNVVPSLIELPWTFGEFRFRYGLSSRRTRCAWSSSRLPPPRGKNVGFANQKGAVLAIAACAFGWRALARELVGHIPLGGGLIPKRRHCLCRDPIPGRQGPGISPRTRWRACCRAARTASTRRASGARPWELCRKLYI